MKFRKSTQLALIALSLGTCITAFAMEQSAPSQAEQHAAFQELLLKRRAKQAKRDVRELAGREQTREYEAKKAHIRGLLKQREREQAIIDAPDLRKESVLERMAQREAYHRQDALRERLLAAKDKLARHLAHIDEQLKSNPGDRRNHELRFGIANELERVRAEFAKLLPRA